MSKVAQVNLEYGMPTVDIAMKNMNNALISYKRQNYKAVILIHGYGSTGVGGKIKNALRNSLNENSLRGIVRLYAGGEQWGSRKSELLSLCKDLKNYESKLMDNPGITIVVLR